MFESLKISNSLALGTLESPRVQAVLRSARQPESHFRALGFWSGLETANGELGGELIFSSFSPGIFLVLFQRNATSRKALEAIDMCLFVGLEP